MKEPIVNLTYAVDRLYETGWLPAAEMDLERLEDGRRYPSVLAVQREFARAGLELSIKQNLMFKCYRATWESGTVIASCEREAAVYALAQLRLAQIEQQEAPIHEIPMSV